MPRNNEDPSDAAATPIGFRVTADELVALSLLLEVDSLPGLGDLPIPDDVSASAGRRGLVARGLFADARTGEAMPLGALTIAALTQATARCTVIDARPDLGQCSSWSFGPTLYLLGTLHQPGVYDVVIGPASAGRATLGRYLASLIEADGLDAEQLAAQDAPSTSATHITAHSATGDANELWIVDVVLVSSGGRLAQAEPDALVSCRPALDELCTLLGLPRSA